LKERLPLSDLPEPTDQADVPPWLWWSAVSLLIIVLAVGLGLAGALALGWRSPTPRRTPDWEGADIQWTPYGEGLHTTSGAMYSLRLSQPEQSGWAVGDPWISDFDLELDAHSSAPDQNVDYGLLYRYQDAENHYRFGIGSDGYYSIGIVRDGKAIPVRTWQQWPHVRRGDQTNRLRVRCEGPTCRFFINGEYTAEISDDAFLRGKIGVWAQSFSDETLEITWLGIRLWALD